MIFHLLFACWYVPVFTLLTISSGVLCIIASFVSPGLARRISNPIWAHMVLDPAGIRVRVRGRENLPAGGGFIIYANHASMTDIPTVALASGRHVTWVAKAALARIPVFGWALRRVHLLVDRSGGAEAAKKMVAEATQRIEAGEILAIFPEGTRNRGERLLLPFKKGTFILGKHTSAPIFPLAIKGAREAWPPGRLWPRPGRLIRVSIGPPLTPEPGETLAGLTQRAQKVLEILLQETDG